MAEMKHRRCTFFILFFLLERRSLPVTGGGGLEAHDFTQVRFTSPVSGLWACLAKSHKRFNLTLTGYSGDST